MAKKKPKDIAAMMITGVTLNMLGTVNVAIAVSRHNNLSLATALIMIVFGMIFSAAAIAFTLQK